MVKKVLVDLCDEEWVVVVAVMHLIMAVVVVVEVEVVETEEEEVEAEVHHGLHGINTDINPVI
jgi:hypothetical protein